MKSLLLVAFLIAASAPLLTSCDGYLDKSGARYITLSYSGGMPVWKNSSDSKESDDAKIPRRDPSLSATLRLQQLESAIAYNQFLVSLGPQFEKPIDFDASNATLTEILEKLGKATGTVIAFDLESSITQRITVKARKYYPEEILNKVIDFYGLKASFTNSRMILVPAK